MKNNCPKRYVESLQNITGPISEANKVTEDRARHESLVLEKLGQTRKTLRKMTFMSRD